MAQARGFSAVEPQFVRLSDKMGRSGSLSDNNNGDGEAEELPRSGIEGHTSVAVPWRSVTSLPPQRGKRGRLCQGGRPTKRHPTAVPISLMPTRTPRPHQ